MYTIIYFSIKEVLLPKIPLYLLTIPRFYNQYYYLNIKIQGTFSIRNNTLPKLLLLIYNKLSRAVMLS